MFGSHPRHWDNEGDADAHKDRQTGSQFPDRCRLVSVAMSAATIAFCIHTSVSRGDSAGLAVDDADRDNIAPEHRQDLLQGVGKHFKRTDPAGAITKRIVSCLLHGLPLRFARVSYVSPGSVPFQRMPSSAGGIPPLYRHHGIWIQRTS